MAFDKYVWEFFKNLNGITPKKMFPLSKVSNAVDADATVTAGQLMRGYYEKTGCTAGRNLTLDTVPNIQAVFTAQAGRYFRWLFMNSSGQIITLVAPANMTLNGLLAVPDTKCAIVYLGNGATGLMEGVVSLSA